MAAPIVPLNIKARQPMMISVGYRKCYDPSSGVLTVAKHDEPLMDKLMITPAAAAELLAVQNTRNRNVRPDTVEQYARDMLSGRWLMSGDTLRFGHEGTLLDGQHRLAAVVRADMDVPMITVWNLDEDAQRVMDTGRKRTVGNQLTLAGMKHSNMLASTATVLLCLARMTPNNSMIPQYKFSEQEVMAKVFEDEAGLMTAVEAGRHVYQAIRANPSVAGAVYYLASQIDPDLCVEFYDKLVNGIGLNAGDPELLLRNAAVRQSGTLSREDKSVMYAHFVKAWNMKREGRTGKIITYTPSRERMPELI